MKQRNLRAAALGAISFVAFGAGFTTDASAAPERRPARPFKVVIDPGHGGSDHGTIYDNGLVKIAEKDVTLALALEAARQLRARGIQAVLTRDADRELDLGARTALANKMGADAFISIHMNSTATPMVTDAEGVETYFFNAATDGSSRRLAHLENSVLGGRAVDAPEPMDVALILKDLRLNANLAESKRLACAVQDGLVTATSGPKAPRHRNRGVKQALFHVLLGADMPSILVEAGFLTSPRDRAMVLAPEGRRSIGKAVADAVTQFRQQKDTRRALMSLSRCKVHEQPRL